MCSVASRGIFLPLQVFYTVNKGWGVRCEVDLPIGTFICCYIGRVCTNSEANELRGRDEYLFDLNHFESVAQHLAQQPGDATPVSPLCRDFSSVTRFLLHVLVTFACRQS